MELSKRVRIGLGIATLLEVAFPLLIVLLFLLVFILMPIMMAANPEIEANISFFFIFGWMLVAFSMICFSTFQIILKVSYLYLILSNKQASELGKILFILGTFYLPYIAMPVYYVIYFLKEKEDGAVPRQLTNPVSPP